ncbi:MAG: uroporphyrinogen-III synthase [Bacteroidetes bacterium]|nr:uroporphyrinogen-III synthase [Bacteroidota bacterium]
MPGNSYSILCTSEMDSANLNFIQENISIDVIPFIEKRICDHEEIEKNIQDFLQKEITAVFTSQTAVSAVLSKSKNQPPWKIYCIDNATKNAILKFFPQVFLQGIAANAGSLASMIIANGEKDIVFFCGNKRLNDLPNSLAAAGILLEECVVYDTFILNTTVQKNYDAIIFCSPSAVEGFFKSNVIRKNTTLFSLGKKTSEAIQNFSENLTIEASYPDKNQLLHQAVFFLQQQITTP